MVTIAVDHRLVLDNGHSSTLQNENVKWTWACRILNHLDEYKLDTAILPKPRVGDLALFKVQQIGQHESLVTIDNKKMRIYEDDLLVGVFGNRYATDAFEAEVDGITNLSMLTAAGMVGTVKSRHRSVKTPTTVSFVGYLNDLKGRRVNLKRLKANNAVTPTKESVGNLLVVVGSAMNSGKTTTASKIIKKLSEIGLKVAGCKLTGSVSNRDQDEMRSAQAVSIIDFSDYGFPSTYLCTKEDLMTLFNTMLSDLAAKSHDLIVMEIADGLLQRETDILLSDQTVKKMIDGIVLTAESAPSALYATEHLKKLGYKIVTVSGAITSSPLAVKEFKDRSEIPITSSAFSGRELSEIIADKFFKSALAKKT